eukprot:scaffold45018_cov57-Phaeocystis_antarctica.AAC.1
MADWCRRAAEQGAGGLDVTARTGKVPSTDAGPPGCCDLRPWLLGYHPPSASPALVKPKGLRTVG